MADPKTRTKKRKASADTKHEGTKQTFLKNVFTAIFSPENQSWISTGRSGADGWFSIQEMDVSRLISCILPRSTQTPAFVRQLNFNKFRKCHGMWKYQKTGFYKEEGHDWPQIWQAHLQEMQKSKQEPKRRRLSTSTLSSDEDEEDLQQTLKEMTAKHQELSRQLSQERSERQKVITELRTELQSVVQSFAKDLTLTLDGTVSTFVQNGLSIATYRLPNTTGVLLPIACVQAGLVTAEPMTPYPMIPQTPTGPCPSDMHTDTLELIPLPPLLL